MKWLVSLCVACVLVRVTQSGTVGPGVEGPGTVGPGVEGPGTVGPGVEGPGTVGPGDEGPGTVGPGVEGPGTQGPGVQGPGTVGPGVEGPGTQRPGVQGPGTVGPGTLGPGVLPEVPPEDLEFLESTELLSVETTNYHDGAWDPPEPHHPVQHAGPVRNLVAVPLPLKDSDHELMFNVSWLPPLGPRAADYSLEIHSETDTEDCRMTMCYEYNIPGSATWWAIPAHASPVPETCAVRPGCKYRVNVVAHPWDGRTVASLLKQLDECEAGICSCAHAPRLPAPRVRAEPATVGGEALVNVSWTLPPPAHPQRLPKGLGIQFYFVSIGQQMVSDAHPSPWFANKVTRHIAASGLIATGDGPRFLLLPMVEKNRDKLKNVKLLARVSVVDERTCIGPAGNATAYDPAKSSKVSIDTYILWVVWLSLAGVLLLCVAGAAASGAGAAKRVLRALRPAPAAARPVARRGWFT